MKAQIIIPIIILISVVSYLIISSVKTTMVYYYTVSELYAQLPDFSCRVNGKVVKNTLKHLPNTFDYYFEITDGKKKLPVQYKGVVSDIFQEGIEVVAEGKYDKNKKIFIAQSLLTKCPSKYESKLDNKK